MYILTLFLAKHEMAFMHIFCSYTRICNRLRQNLDHETITLSHTISTILLHIQSGNPTHTVDTSLRKERAHILRFEWLYSVPNDAVPDLPVSQELGEELLKPNQVLPQLLHRCVCVCV